MALMAASHTSLKATNELNVKKNEHFSFHFLFVILNNVNKYNTEILQALG